jgi:NIMA-interacting peptidyl-prolyl cis-trans isomerase 1
MTIARPLSVLSLVLAVGCGGSAPEAKSAAPAEAASATPSPAPAASAATATAASGPASAAPSSAPASSPPPAPSSEPAAASADAAVVASPNAKPRATKISARHVLIQWMGCDQAPTSVVRTRDQALVVAKEVLRRARAGEDFARLAIEYSDEPNAGQRGGSLGRFGRGAMVKGFEDAAFALQPGQISDIVETGFGFHIIQRTE